MISYPAAFSLATVQPTVRLEVGPIAAWTPNEPRKIRPYVAEQLPELFTAPATNVNTISVERTFWEKATILHQEAHHGVDKPLPPRYSRHYYDLYKLSLLPVCGKALARLDLLKEVAAFKMRFYRCAWARYEDARPGSLCLLPTAHHERALRRDYTSMGQMLFGEIPSFDEIMKGLKTLETAVNAIAD